jgi:hypothetical protein
MGRKGMHIGFLVGKPQGKRPLRRDISRLEENIKMGFRDRMGFYELD